MGFPHVADLRGDVAYLHHLGSAHQEVQDPVAQLCDELGGHYGVEG